MDDSTRVYVFFFFIQSCVLRLKAVFSGVTTAFSGVMSVLFIQQSLYNLLEYIRNRDLSCNRPIIRQKYISTLCFM